MTKKKEYPLFSDDQIINMVRERCDEVGDCWLWKGAMTGRNSTPNMRHPNRPRTSAISTRSIVLEAMGVPQPSPAHWASNTCNDIRCCCPDHVAWRTRASKLRDSGKAGKWTTLESAIKKAAIHQARSPLNWDKVRDIRGRAPEVTHKALAIEFGVDPQTIKRVRTHQSWIEYQTNPFAGLFAGLAANDGGRKRA